jgi:16S rRNA (guanine966-N2)-methyltransferase
MALKITAGLLKGLVLHPPKGLGTRPTSSMVREAVFSIIGGKVSQAKVLDLFAGSGAMGLEALSRGALSCLLCDRAAGAAASVNQSFSRLPPWAKDKARFLKITLPGQLKALEPWAPFDLVFLDPPYLDLKSPLEVLKRLPPYLSPGALAVWEQDAKTPDLWDPSALSPLALISLRRWGGKAAAFLELPQKE